MTMPEMPKPPDPVKRKGSNFIGPYHALIICVALLAFYVYYTTFR